MNMPLTGKTVAAITVALLLPALAIAGKTHQKPGLWEIRTQSTIVSDQARASAAHRSQMSPEVMARMKAMGIQMPQYNSDGSMTQSQTHQFCLTPEQAAKAEHPELSQDQQRHCKITQSSYSGNTFKAVMVCDSPEMKGTGQIAMTMSSDEAYEGTMHFSGNGSHSGKMEMANHMSGRWLGADCGTVKAPDAAAAARAEAMRRRMGQLPAAPQ